VPELQRGLRRLPPAAAAWAIGRSAKRSATHARRDGP
jgi:hypothetical protein